MSGILVPVDFSTGTDSIIREAENLAKKVQQSLILLHVAAPNPDFVGYETGPETVRQQVAERFREEHRTLQDIKDKLSSRGIDAEALLVQGPTVEKILSEQKRLGADWIVIGSHGHSAVYDLLVGSVAEGILRHTTCPVIVIPCQQGR